MEILTKTPDQINEMTLDQLSREAVRLFYDLVSLADTISSLGIEFEAVKVLLKEKFGQAFIQGTGNIKEREIRANIEVNELKAREAKLRLEYERAKNIYKLGSSFITVLQSRQKYLNDEFNRTKIT